MAKWGEGDPRWIVEERADAKNVNNWHWTEKNATQWSKDKIKQLLEKFKIENENYSCEITEVTKCEGEAVANNRKGKLIFFYEWLLEADWMGEILGGSNKTKFKGKLEVPNLSEENSADELDVSVSVTSTSADANAIKEFMRLEGAVVVRQKLGQYIEDLKTEYSRGLILPTKNGSTTGEVKQPCQNAAKIAMSQPVIAPSTQPASGESGVRIVTKKLSLQEEFFCTPDDLYKAFVEKDLLRAFTRSDVIAEKEKGGRFALFGGTICGFYDEFNPSSSLNIRWRHKSWPDEHYSHVHLEFSACDSGTKLVLNQTGIPEREMDSTKGGWQHNYFEAIKQTFGYGGRMF